MVSIPKEDILALIGKYLVGVGEERLAKKVFKASGRTLEQAKAHPLLKKKLQKIIKHYANDHPKIYNYYSSQQEMEKEDDSTDERPMIKESHPNKKVKLQEADPNYAGTVLSGFSKPKLLETTVIDKLEVVQFHQEDKELKKKNKKKHKLVEPSESEEENGQEEEVEEEMSEMELSPSKIKPEEDEEEEEVAPSKRKRTPPKRQPLKCQIKPITPPIQPQADPTSEPHKKFFSRINKDEIGELPEELRDNSFHAKFKYGAGDEWGKYGYEKLKDTRGDGFKKQKGKLKNKAFQASGIDMFKINSIQLS